MSHVPVYQTGRTQLSPHLLLSQSPVPLSLVFIFLTLHRLSFTTVPHARRFSYSESPRLALPHRNVSVFTFKHNHQSVLDVCVRSRQTHLWLHDSFGEHWGKIRTALTIQCAALIIAPLWCAAPLSVPYATHCDSFAGSGMSGWTVHQFCTSAPIFTLKPKIMSFWSLSGEMSDKALFGKQSEILPQINTISTLNSHISLIHLWLVWLECLARFSSFTRCSLLLLLEFIICIAAICQLIANVTFI